MKAEERIERYRELLKETSINHIDTLQVEFNRLFPEEGDEIARQHPPMENGKR